MILLKNVFLNDDVCDILINENKIAKIANKLSTSADEIIDCRDKAIFPSFCNTHTHASMMFLRGVGEDKNLFDWLNQDIFPREAKLKPEHIYPLSRYAILEMIKTGTTCFTDMYFYVSETLKAVQNMGIRAVLPYLGMDFFDDKNTEKHINEALLYLDPPSPNSKIKNKMFLL